MLGGRTRAAGWVIHPICKSCWVSSMCSEQLAVAWLDGIAQAVYSSGCSPCLQEFSSLADAMMQGKATDAGPMPPNLIPEQWSFLPPVVLDTVPFGGYQLLMPCSQATTSRCRLHACSTLPVATVCLLSLAAGTSLKRQ